ncbi:unnamed protein product [Brassicogethes aeneus]|uniref:THAP-type domain-containing protein n=1 Tax=Brassicogethes aeneus TaxID=1431903 RepID=A0A9P0B9B1_BRAAE|nr:unnamed protein product [Brassicogethes aeneus]
MHSVVVQMANGKMNSFKCFVPHCESNNLDNPDKIFVYVPTQKERRTEWVRIVYNDPKRSEIPLGRALRCCEDHFDMDDFENYKLFKDAPGTRLKMKAFAVPHKNLDREKNSLNPNFKCFVPHCESNNLDNPDKIFVYVPYNKERRTEWVRIVYNDPKRSEIPLGKALRCCEDHFDMDDFKNYKLFKDVPGTRLKMQAFAVPHKNINRENNNSLYEKPIRRRVIIKPSDKFDINNGSIYNNKGVHIKSDVDLCDCLDEACLGCFFNCEKCGSQKCGIDCRSYRKFLVETVEFQGYQKVHRNPISLL